MRRCLSRNMKDRCENMEFEQLVKLIDVVSKSALSSFKYEEKGVKLSLQKESSAKAVTVYREEELPIPEAPVRAEKQEGCVVKSPLVGTFYTAPSEDADPFVQVGDQVKSGQTLAIVEAMKLMNEIESEYTGEIKEVLVENGQMVEYGQPLFRIG